MSLFQCSFFSKTLCTTTKVIVCLPSPSSKDALGMSLDDLYCRKETKLLYLLHGMFEDETIWIRRSNVERYASTENIAVVMPYGENNYYVDMAHGLPYFTFLTEELPRFVETSFHLHCSRENTAIAGLSMGGYGACRTALLRPQQYGTFASFSGAVDIEALAIMAKQIGMEFLMNNILGENKVIKDSDADLFYLSSKLVQSKQSLPMAYLTCGMEDTDCYPMNEKLMKHFQSIQYPFFYRESPGAHEWDVWEKEIRQFLNWFAKKDSENALS